MIMRRSHLTLMVLLASSSLPALAAAQSVAPYGPTPAAAAAEATAPQATAAPVATVDLVPPDKKQGTAIVPALADALCEVYLTNPALLGERAKLRSTDEGVPTALAGWRPQISYQVSPGWGYGTITNRADETSLLTGKRVPVSITTANSRWTYNQQVTITQPGYRGGRTVAATAQAENAVRAERARLLAQEEQSFSDGVSAYVGVVSDQRLYDLQNDNVEVLTKQLDATNQRFRLGEVDRTDVAQAQAALAGAIAERDTAYATLQTARATYRQVVGALPAKLVDPQPLPLPVKSLEEANRLAATGNATVIAAAFDQASAKDQIDGAYAALMPEASLQVTGSYANQTTIRGTIIRGGSVGGVINAPIYQGGSEYAAIRQAKQNEQESRHTLDAARAAAVQQASQYWISYLAAKDAVVANRQEVRADEIALDGVEREALAGTQTTQDVLYAEQQLLTARVSLVQTLGTVVTDSYSLAAAIGRLTAKDLGLHVPLYDETAYYNDVRLLPWGTGDHAIDQPGR